MDTGPWGTEISNFGGDIISEISSNPRQGTVKEKRSVLGEKKDSLGFQLKKLVDWWQVKAISHQATKKKKPVQNGEVTSTFRENNKVLKPGGGRRLSHRGYRAGGEVFLSKSGRNSTGTRRKQGEVATGNGERKILGFGAQGKFILKTGLNSQTSKQKKEKVKTRSTWIPLQR